jgi:hypothetical protein
MMIFGKNLDFLEDGKNVLGFMSSYGVEDWSLRT